MTEETAGAGGGEGGSRWGPWALPALAGVGLPALFFFRAVFTRDVFMAGDTLRVFYPLRAYWAARVSALQLPEWFPHDGFGQSFPAIFISGMFHPTALLHLVLPLGAAVKLTLLLCYPVALLGTWGLARAYGVSRAGALFAAITFAFSGYLVCITNNPTYLLSASAVPAALWAVVRYLRQPSPGRLAGAGALLALVAFAGDAQAFAMVSALAVLVAAVDPEAGPVRRRVGACALLIVTAVLLAAPQLLPAAGLVASGEPGARSAVEAQRFSLHPMRLWELLVGPFFVDAKGVRGIPEAVVRHAIPAGGFTRVWVDSVYLGTPACVLALAALATSLRGARARVLLVAWLLLLGLCLGQALPLYGWVYQLVPLWRPFRYPEKLVPLVTLGLAVAAGLGWQRCFSPGGHRKALAWAGVAVAVACAAVALGEAVWGLWSQGWLLRRWPEASAAVVRGLSGNVVSTAAAAAVLALACAVLAVVDSRPGARASLLVLLQGAALFVAHEPLYLLASEEMLEVAPPFAQRIREQVPPGEPVRVASSVRNLGSRRLQGYSFRDQLSLAQLAALLPDTSLFWDLESANGYLPGESVRVRRLKQDLPRWYGALAPRLGTPFSIHEASELKKSGLPPSTRVVAEDPLFETVLLEHPDAAPRVHLARPRCVGGLDEALRVLTAPEPPPAGTAVVECTAPLPESADSVAGTVRVERPSPEELTARVESPGPAVLVVNDALQPGWTATLDGAEVPILPANVAVRAVAVPAGQHVVELRYRTPGLRAGMGVGALALLALGAAGGLQRKSRRSKMKMASAVKTAAHPRL